MEAVVGPIDRAPDRLTRVVHQDVDRPVPLEHLGCHPVDVVRVGEVASVHVGDAAEALDLVGHLLKLVGPAGDGQHRPPPPAPPPPPPPRARAAAGLSVAPPRAPRLLVRGPPPPGRSPAPGMRWPK